MPVDFDSYWSDLVDRVEDRQEALTGPEELVYRLTCIYGETMVDGIESYFERRFEEYDRDLETLRNHGFPALAADFAEARRIMFGTSPLTEAEIAPLLERFLEEDEALRDQARQLQAIYGRLVERLPDLLDYRDRIGVQAGLFEPEAES
jgi:hypothetical protein